MKLSPMLKHEQIFARQFGSEGLVIYDHPLSLGVDLVGCSWEGVKGPAIDIRKCEGLYRGRFIFTAHAPVTIIGAWMSDVDIGVQL